MTGAQAGSAAGLRVENLHAWYGQAHVLHGVGLRVAPGEIVGLLGRNGSGRSTVARAVMGLAERRGAVVWRGEDISGLKPFEIARRGIGYVPETQDIFPGMTVAQNLLLGQKSRQPGRWTTQRMAELFPALGRRLRTPAHLLSGGEKQMLALCRTLMGDPALMLVDEPAEGLAPQVVAQLADFFRLLRDGGMAIVLIEQKLDMVLELADRVQVLGHGRTVFEGSPMALRGAADVRKEWLEL